MSKVKKVFMVVIPFVFLISLVLSGCGNSKSTGGAAGAGKNGQVVTLQMSAWGNPEELKVYQRGIDAFEKLNPNIKINLVPIPSDSYEQKLMTELSGGKGPDVFYVGDQTMSKLAKNKSIIPLNDFMKTQDSYAKESEFSPGLWGSSKQNGIIYGIPVDCNPLVMYYNKTLFKQLGLETPQQYYDEGKWNWDTFKMIADKFKAAKKYAFVEGNDMGTFNTWVWSNGGQIYDDNGNYVLDKNQKAQEAFNYVSDLVKGGGVIYGGSLPKGQGQEAMFQSGQVGMISAGRWDTPLFLQDKSLDFDYIYWPSNNGNKTNPVYIPTAYLSVNKNTPYKKEAEKFVTFYTSKQGQKARLQNSGNAIPSISGIDDVVQQNGIVKHSDYLLTGRDKGIANGAPQTFDGNVPGLQNDEQDAIDLMLLGKKSVTDTIAKITQLANKEISAYKNGQ